jgi:hypothetical protein
VPEQAESRSRNLTCIKVWITLYDGAEMVASFKAPAYLDPNGKLCFEGQEAWEEAVVPQLEALADVHDEVRTWSARVSAVAPSGHDPSLGDLRDYFNPIEADEDSEPRSESAPED